jgi:hypothetical protein
MQISYVYGKNGSLVYFFSEVFNNLEVFVIFKTQIKHFNAYET